MASYFIIIYRDPLVTNQTLSFFAGEWANTDTSTVPVATCSPALERARMHIPSCSHLLGDNSTNDSSVDKERPFVSLLPDLIQSSAREEPDVTRHCHLPTGAASSASIPPSLHFTRMGSPPSLVSWQELRSLCRCLHDLTSCSTHQMGSSGICVK